MSLEKPQEICNKDPSSSSSSHCSESYEFLHAVAKIAVSQICESVGYTHFKDPPLESLTGIAVQYILQLGKSATSFANLTGRTQCNVFDIILALEDLNPNDEEEAISSDSSSIKLKEIIDFVKLNEETPFSQPLPSFPIPTNQKLIPSFDEIGETPPGNHIPSWLPAFPDPHTYKETPMWIKRESNPRGDKIEQARQRRKAEGALLSLQKKLISKISSHNHIWGDMDTLKQEPETESPSPEKVETLDKDNLSVIQAFTPAMEATSDEVFTEQKEKKPVVLSKLRNEKKFLREPLDLSLQMKDEDRSVAFVRDEARDDKKRRAEFILRQCMENPVDLNQL